MNWTALTLFLFLSALAAQARPYPSVMRDSKN